MFRAHSTLVLEPGALAHDPGRPYLHTVELL